MGKYDWLESGEVKTFTYEEDFKSKRADGRIVESLPAFMEYLRRTTPRLAMPKGASLAEFKAWQTKLRDKVAQLLDLPEKTEQPSPVLLSSVQRDGYRTEKWEFYPDDVSAVPVLMLVPDTATAEHPVPAVMCFPGSEHTKELLAGEPSITHPKGHGGKFPDRNCMARHIAESGMVAVAFDPIAIGELAPDTKRVGEHGGFSRHYLTYGYLEYGTSYTAVSVFQKLCFLDFLKTLPFVDKERIGLSAHSLGTETAITLGLISDDVKAVVFNNLLYSPRDRYRSVTEMDENDLFLSPFWSHIMPGKYKYFGFQDLCAAFAPRYLALNEGGAYEYEATVRHAYRLTNAEDRLLFTHYPQYADPATRTYDDTPLPAYGLSESTYFAHNYTVPSDHSFRKEPSLALLRKAFGMEEN